jgi:hypothetical protein
VNKDKGEPSLRVFGADFSGAQNPTGGIFYAEGELKDDVLVVKSVVNCDDRLDLLAAIHFSKAPWGLDFPFSLPSAALERLHISSWPELLDRTSSRSRNDYSDFLSGSLIDGCEARCSKESPCCRKTDAVVGAFSPLKKTNPNMQMMTYAGLKMLAYLRKLGSRVYPFDEYHPSAARLYEVYPSHSWKQTGLKRSENLEKFVQIFSADYGLKIKLTDKLYSLSSIDAADAVVACITIGYAILKGGVEPGWQVKPARVSEAEWAKRYREGLVVKIPERTFPAE